MNCKQRKHMQKNSLTLLNWTIHYIHMAFLRTKVYKFFPTTNTCRIETNFKDPLSWVALKKQGNRGTGRWRLLWAMVPCTSTRKYRGENIKFSLEKTNADQCNERRRALRAIPCRERTTEAEAEERGGGGGGGGLRKEGRKQGRWKKKKGNPAVVRRPKPTASCFGDAPGPTTTPLCKRGDGRKYEGTGQSRSCSWWHWGKKGGRRTGVSSSTKSEVSWPPPPLEVSRISPPPPIHRGSALHR